MIEFDDFVIRNWKPEDATSLAKHANNRKIWINMRDVFPFPYKFSDAKAFLEIATKRRPETPYAIATSQEAIGGIGLNFQKDVQRYSAELGYWLAEPFWGQGIMTTAVKAFSSLAFDMFELHRIFAIPYAYNTASIRVLEKSGFANEGRLRASAFKDGKIVDQFIYARLDQSLSV